jgi:hypothetical protein
MIVFSFDGATVYRQIRRHHQTVHTYLASLMMPEFRRLSVHVERDALFSNIDMEVFRGKITPALTLQSSTNESERFAAKHSRNSTTEVIN